jgi:rabenosyn-5
MTTPQPTQIRRVFGGAILPSLQSSSRNQSRSPTRSPGLRNSGSSQSPDQLSLSGNEDERENTLSCPICNEAMITLLQLNRHLDDMHREVEEVQKETLKSWLKKRMIKAKSLPPVVALNQKLGKSEPFERNGDQPGKYGADATVVADEIVTRKHWQQENGNDFCSEPSCGKFLNNRNGHINCKLLCLFLRSLPGRKCGKLFCDTHTMYQIKLSMSAQYEPVRYTFFSLLC